MMIRWINKQPGIQKIWNWYGHYEDIYDWISPLHKQSGLWFILTQQSSGGGGGYEYGKSSHLSILPSLKHLMNAFEALFSGLHFYTLLQTLHS